MSVVAAYAKKFFKVEIIENLPEIVNITGKVEWSSHMNSLRKI
jgi:hypothetical protein